MTEKGVPLTAKGEIRETNIKPDAELSISYLRGYASCNPDPAGYTFSKDEHSLFQMAFVLKGTVNWSTLGSRKPFATIQQQQHNLVLINPRQSCLQFSPDEYTEVIYINLGADFLFRYLPAEHPCYPLFADSMQKKKAALFAVQNMHITPEINAILSSLENSAHTGFSERLFLKSKIIELLALQFSQFELLAQNTRAHLLKKDIYDKMNEAREILIGSSERQLSLRKLAHMVGTNEFNLKKQFKVAFGTTVFGYLNQYKMERAKAMLIAGDVKIAEVSDKMGYKHATHFTSAFKKYFGYVPNKIKMLFLLFDPELFIPEFILYLVEA